MISQFAFLRAVCVLIPGLAFSPIFLGVAGAQSGTPSAGSLRAAFEEDEGRFLGSVESAKAIITGKIQAEVEAALADARKTMSSGASGAKDALKLELEKVESVPDLTAEVQAQLREQIMSTLKEAGRREFEAAEKRAGNEEAKAARLERQLLVEEAARRDMKLKQIMDRLNSLFDENRFAEAETRVAELVRELAPGEQIGESAVWNAHNKGNVLEMYALREHRHKSFVDALFQCERAQVPFPDDPPIVYPDAEVWEELTLRRKKYASMDLAKQGSAETKIFAALSDSTTLEFIETPLKDVIDYLKDLHGIEIQIDVKALETVGVATDTPVTRNLKGVSLRSALRLLLKDLDLTYMVRDEVLQITTPEVVGNSLTTKVYPVGDLVLPINSGATANPFFLGGGLGGQGGFGGGLNGVGNNGFGPGGGNGFGPGGGNGLGIGFMSVDDEPSPVKAKQKPQQVELFSAAKEGQIEVSFIPKSALEASVVVKNKTDRPLKILLPEAFAAAPILAQPGGLIGGPGGFPGGGFPGGGFPGGGLGGSGNQAVGGGFGPGGGIGPGVPFGPGGPGRFPGGFMNVGAGKTSKKKVHTVCLEHGKPDPHARVKYELLPVESIAKSPEIVELCRLVGRGDVDPQAAQAAAWHLANGLSWEQLTAKIGAKHLDGSVTPMFTQRQLSQAEGIVKDVSKRATAGQAADSRR